MTLEVQTQHPDEARRLVEGRLTQAPDNPTLLLAAARVYATGGDTAKSEAALKKAIEKDPSSLVAYNLLGQLYVRSGRLERALQVSPNFAGAEEARKTLASIRS